jgi:hypothetical protein
MVRLNIENWVKSGTDVTADPSRCQALRSHLLTRKAPLAPDSEWRRGLASNPTRSTKKPF